MSTITGTPLGDTVAADRVSAKVSGGPATTANDMISGLGGSDILYGGSGNDVIDGGADEDLLYGQVGDDTLLGGDGNDYLSGGVGNDILYDGPGDDTLDGGEGTDTAVSTFSAPTPAWRQEPDGSWNVAGVGVLKSVEYVRFTNGLLDLTTGVFRSVGLQTVALDVNRPEGPAGTTAFTFVVTRTGDTSSFSSADWFIEGSGTNPASASDFASGFTPRGTVIFAPGETTKTITIEVAGDIAVEKNESFTLGWHETSFGTVIEGPVASGTIWNDDTVVLEQSVTTASTTAVNTVIGSGANTLVVKISEDAWKGHAQYTIKVDGMLVSDTLTAGASHALGQSETVTIKGNWGSAAHKVEVAFLNDDWGGTSSTDRNLHVEGITYDGQAVHASTASIMQAGATAFKVPASTTAVNITAGSGDNMLILKISEQAYKGDAQYTIKVDGVQVGGTFTASANHALGQSDTVTLKGNWVTGAHTVEVAFLNDDWDRSINDWSTPQAADRNLYVDGIIYDGHVVANSTIAMMSNGSVEVTLPSKASSDLHLFG